MFFSENSPLIDLEAKSTGNRSRATSHQSVRSRSDTFGSWNSDSLTRKNSSFYGLNNKLPDLADINFDISKSRYDQSTYSGRAAHFFLTTSPFNIFASDKELEHVKTIVEEFLNGTTLLELGLTTDDVWKAKQLYDSAYHPQTGEKVLFFGRMSFSVYANMFISGCMLTFCKHPLQILFWQWMNQSYNAFVNYANRNASVSQSLLQLGTGYITACLLSMSIALYLNMQMKSVGSKVAQHLVPFVAVSTANAVNIPLMRMQELRSGISIELEDGTVVGRSTVAAKDAIWMVVFSRVVMAMMPLSLPPLIMYQICQFKFMTFHSWLEAPITVFITGLALTIAIPLSCALFPQMGELSIDRVEPILKKEIESKYPNQSSFFYNKGL